MSSTFGFNFEAEDEDSSDALDVSIALTSKDMVINDASAPLVETRIHAMDKLLSGFPSSLQYHCTLSAFYNGQPITIAQRDFYDIKAQLMAEDDGPEGIHGISSQDLEPRVYEGGLKTWECAEDMSKFLIQNLDTLLVQGRDSIVLELGAGTAIPSCTILSSHLARGAKGIRQGALRLMLSDYNESVLEVATIPNIFLAWAANTTPKSSDTVDVTTEIKDAFVQSMSDERVSFDAISGGWSPSFVDEVVSRSRLGGYEQSLILASETIYSPDSLRQFTATLVEIMKAFQRKGARPTVLVASKKIYFGVGGGIDDFIALLSDHGAHGQVAWQTTGEGVGRAILSVSLLNT